MVNLLCQSYFMTKMFLEYSVQVKWTSFMIFLNYLLLLWYFYEFLFYFWCLCLFWQPLITMNCLFFGKRSIKMACSMEIITVYGVGLGMAKGWENLETIVFFLANCRFKFWRNFKKIKCVETAQTLLSLAGGLDLQRNLLASLISEAD